MMLYLSISRMKLKTNNVLVSMGVIFVFGFCVYIFTIPTRSHNYYGWYFSVGCQISAKPVPGHFSPRLDSKAKFSHEMLTTRPKNISEDFIDLWFNWAKAFKSCKSSAPPRLLHPDEVSAHRFNLVWSSHASSPLSMSPSGCVIAPGQRQSYVSSGQEGRLLLALGC